VTGAEFGAMLDPSLAVYDASGTLLALAATENLTETLSMMLVPGSYEVAVMSAGNPGDLGQYTLTGSLAAIAPVPEPVFAASALFGSLLLIPRRRRRT
jgi:hypothetical protein